MNGGRVAKRLLAVVLALSTLVTLGLYYNGLSSGARMMDDRPQPAALLRRGNADWPRRSAADGLSNEVDPAEAKKRRPAADEPHRPAAPVLTATVDRDTCPALGLANTTIDTVAQFSRFEFQVSVAVDLFVYPFTCNIISSSIRRTSRQHYRTVFFFSNITWFRSIFRQGFAYKW